MTVAEAIRHLEARARHRCDQHTVTWSLEDVTAARTIIAAVPLTDDPDGIPLSHGDPVPGGIRPGPDTGHTEPTIDSQWAVIDRWWTDEPDPRTYIAIRVNDQEAVVRYNPLPQTFELVTPTEVPDEVPGG